MFVEIFILCLLAYLCGSIPFGMLLAKTQNIDIREHGSGNIGATNVTRIIGKKLGFITLIGDVLKGWVIVFLASQWFEKPIFIALAGFMVFFGHLYLKKYCNFAILPSNLHSHQLEIFHYLIFQ